MLASSLTKREISLIRLSCSSANTLIPSLSCRLGMMEHLAYVQTGARPGRQGPRFPATGRSRTERTHHLAVVGGCGAHASGAAGAAPERSADGAGLVAGLSSTSAGIARDLRVSGAATLARIWLAQGQADRVCELIGPRTSHPGIDGGLIGSAIEFGMLHALALRQLDRSDEARTVFARALALAEPGGYVRLFVDEGEAARLLILDCGLRIENSSTRLAPYRDRLLASFPAPQKSAVQLQPSSPVRSL